MAAKNNDDLGSGEGSDQDFACQYSEKSFWDKLKTAAKLAGREVVEKSLVLYYGRQRPEDAGMGERGRRGGAGLFHRAARRDPRHGSLRRLCR